MDHREGWRVAAGRFADVLDRAELGAQVPACPGWDVADLAHHLGSVYDRFSQVVSGRITEREQRDRIVALARPQDDRELPAWFRARAVAMEAALQDLRDEEPLWNFTRAPQVGAWLPRRMHHETTVHRHDLEEAVGDTTPIPTDVARDGIDEYLTVLATAAAPWDGRQPVDLRVEEVPDGPEWQVRLDPGALAVAGGAAEPDVHLRGGPVELLLALWGRAPLSSVEVAGPEELATSVLAALSR
jgi:uncharacterized protein (TIGR03083 family)